MSAPQPEFAVEIIHLHKTYGASSGGGGKEALRDISLSIPRGSFFGLLGPNGAGKSTLINILAGLVIKTSGEVRVWGFDIEAEMRQARSAIGIVPQELNIDPFFTPRESLETQAGLYGIPGSRRRTDEILAAMHLTDKADAYARTLSGGMRRRLLVAKALVHAPPVLVLDEPTAGVDVDLRQQLWRYIRKLREQGTTILLTTHYLEEAEALCDQIAIINKGELIVSKPTDELVRSLNSKEIIVTLDRDLGELPAALAGFQVERQNARKLVFRVPPGETQVQTLLAAVQGEGFAITDLSTKEADLEDVFLRLTGNGEDTTPA